jgi:hypothetical protein
MLYVPLQRNLHPLVIMSLFQDYRLFMADDTLQEDALSSTEYQMIVAPSLKVAAELAARRGDPTLQADLPAMLALIYLVTGLAGFYREEWADLSGGANKEALQAAPMAACVMVLKQAGLDEAASNQCQQALQGAYKLTIDAELGWTAKGHIETAWRHITNDKRDLALASLNSAAEQLVAAIEVWESSRSVKH